MVTAVAVLALFNTSLQLVLEVVKDMTPEQKQKIWNEHLVRQEKLEAFFERFKIGD